MNDMITKRYKTLTTLFCCLLFGAMLTGCMDFDNATQAVSVTIQVAGPEDCPNVSVSGRTVTLNGSSMLQGITNAEGKVTFENIVPEIYNISTAWKMSSEEYSQLTGTVIEKKGYTISGTLSSQLLSASTTEPIVLPTNMTQDQSLLIGKIYYQGSKDDRDKSYTYAKYVELYNNSDADVEIKGLYLALLESAHPTPDYPIQYLSDNVVAKQVFRIPAKTIRAGGTLLIVNSAVDHAAKGASKEPNLLNADFEAKDKNSITKAHENNPDIPELPQLYSFTNNTYMNLVHGGPCSIILFDTDEDVENDWVSSKLVYRYGKNSGYKLMKIPASAVLDAVEILNYKVGTGVDISTKRLFNYLDAGYTYTEAAYDGKLVVRKTLYTTADGRKVLQDTNNSMNDFEVTDELKPREYQ